MPFTRRFCSALALVLFAPFPGSAAVDLFNSQECAAFLSWQGTFEPKLREEGQMRGLSDVEIDEFIRRESRLFALAAVAKRRFEASEIGASMLETIRKVVPPEHRGNRGELWRRILSRHAPGELATLPQWVLSPPRNRDGDWPFFYFALLRCLRIQANYRGQVYEVLSRKLPYRTEIEKASEQDRMKIEPLVEKIFQRLVNVPAQSLYLPPLDLANGAVLRELVAELVAIGIPASIQDELETHLDFLKRYDLQPDPVFVTYVKIVNSLWGLY